MSDYIVELKMLHQDTKNEASVKVGTIKIVNVDYTITKVDPLPIGLSGHHMGRHISSQASILYSSQISEDQIQATIYHEIMHGILEGIGEEDLCNNEGLVERLSRAMLQTFDLKITLAKEMK